MQPRHFWPCGKAHATDGSRAARTAQQVCSRDLPHSSRAWQSEHGSWLNVARTWTLGARPLRDRASLHEPRSCRHGAPRRSSQWHSCTLKVRNCWKQEKRPKSGKEGSEVPCALLDQAWAWFGQAWALDVTGLGLRVLDQAWAGFNDSWVRFGGSTKSQARFGGCWAWLSQLWARSGQTRAFLGRVARFGQPSQAGGTHR